METIMKSGMVKRRGTFGSPVKTSVSLHARMNRLDSRDWRLPSGMALAEFALQSGFLASLLMKVEGAPPPFFEGASLPYATKES